MSLPSVRTIMNILKNLSPVTAYVHVLQEYVCNQEYHTIKDYNNDSLPFASRYHQEGLTLININYYYQG
jgi:hypothetical protein